MDRFRAFPLLVLVSALGACGDSAPTVDRIDAGHVVECISDDMLPPPGDDDAGEGDVDAGDDGSGGRGGGDIDGGDLDGGADVDAGPGGGEMDAGRPTGGRLGCSAGQLCLQGRCYDACTRDDQCGDREMCGAEGVCVSRTRPRPDAGPPPMRDAGPPADPCAALMCMVPTPACHPDTSTCVGCISGAQCGGALNICNLGRGICEEFRGGTCAPCNNMFDCGTDRCVDLAEPSERVCLPVCPVDGSECPQGLLCNDATGNCEPKLGSCGSFEAAVRHLACASDPDCVPLGATPAPGQCVPGDGTAGTGCRHPCGTSDQCPPGFICSGAFCLQSP